jgi:hypothetical protein
MSDTARRQVTIAGRRFDLRRGQIERRMRGILPDPVARHFVVVGGRRYPPKQVIGHVTGLDRADFTTHQARRVLMRLGFATGRRASGSGRQAGATAGTSTGRDPAYPPDSLAGQWIAVKGDEILVAADSPHEVVAWLSRHGERADTMFRVPEDDVAASGLAPS